MKKLRKAIRKAIKYKALGMLTCYNIERDKIDGYTRLEDQAGKEEAESRRNRQEIVRAICWHTLQSM